MMTPLAEAAGSGAHRNSTVTDPFTTENAKFCGAASGAGGERKCRNLVAGGNN